MPPVSFPTVAGHEVSSSWKSQLPKLQRWWNVLRFNLESRSPRLLQRHDFSSLCGTFTNLRPTTSYDVLRFKISWRHSTDGGIFPKISQSSDETSAANHCASDVFMAKQRYNQALSKRQSMLGNHTLHTGSSWWFQSLWKMMDFVSRDFMKFPTEWKVIQNSIYWPCISIY